MGHAEIDSSNRSVMSVEDSDTGDPLNLLITDLEAGKDLSTIREPKLSLQAPRVSGMSKTSREQLTPKPLFVSKPPSLKMQLDSSRHLSPEVRLDDSHAFVPESQLSEEQDDLMREIARYPMVHDISSMITPASTNMAKAVKVLGMTEDDVRSPMTPKTPTIHRSDSNGKLFSSRSLRNMATNSRFSMSKGSVRKKSPPVSTSLKLSEGENDQMTTLISTPTPSHANTLLKRRGKAFKRLSILTSALHPFDPFGGMDISSQGQLQSERSSVIGSSNESSITVTEGPSIQEEVVSADFATLTSTPPPLLSDHPMLRNDPFSISCESPLLATASTSEEIRRTVAELRKYSVSTTGTSSGDSKNSSVRRRLFNFEGRMTSSNSKSADFDETIDTSPLPRKLGSQLASPNHGLSDLTPAPSPLLPAANEDGGDSKSKLRKVSNLFKPRVSTDRAPSGSTTPLESPNLERKDLERYLRITLTSPGYDYSPTDSFPRHPVTGRGWKHRNLRCTTCSEKSCAACGRACCAYKACVGALEIHKDNPEGKADARKKIQEITVLFPYGREASTFIQCTNGGTNGSGCGKMCCPDCVGICPVELCADTQCRKCKRDLWAECGFHRGEGSDDRKAKKKAGRQMVGKDESWVKLDGSRDSSFLERTSM